ncbi:MAG TPA: hypothetical protein VN045_07905, partial [Microbacteriaceae bacterium]|nr:hypothetical protein [Microbacteriaceae bacterium]
MTASHTFRNRSRFILAGFTAISTLALTALTGIGPAAAATPVYQITAEWAPNTPTTVKTGDVVTGVWRVNVNDSAEAPSNDPVDNVTVTVAAQHGIFTALPDACLTTGVT